MVIWIIGTLAVSYVGDWAVWRARVAMGGGMGTVNVGTLIETPLKGNKDGVRLGRIRGRGL